MTVYTKKKKKNVDRDVSGILYGVLLIVTLFTSS